VWVWDFEAESVGANTAYDISSGVALYNAGGLPAGVVTNGGRFGANGIFSAFNTLVDDPISLATLTNFTLCLWVKPFNGNYGGNNGLLFERLYNGGASGAGYIGMFIGGGTQPYVNIGGVSQYAGGPNSGYLPIDFGKGYPALQSVWTHIAVTYNGVSNRIQWYWNGVLGSSNTSAPAVVPGSTSGNGSFTRVGASGSNLPVMDDVAFLNRTLTQAQIQSIYSNGIAAFLASAATPPPPTNITYTVAGGKLVLTWPNGAGWMLQAQTNSANVGLQSASNAWFNVTGTSPHTNAFNTPTTFYRLKY
jgi:hypothetical protein